MAWEPEQPGFRSQLCALQVTRPQAVSIFSPLQFIQPVPSRCVLEGSGSHFSCPSGYSRSSGCLTLLQELIPLLTVLQLRGQYLCLPGPQGPSLTSTAALSSSGGMCVFVCVCVCVVAKSCPTLCGPPELEPTRLLCPGHFPGRNPGVGCHFLLQGIFPTQGLSLHLLLWRANS